MWLRYKPLLVVFFLSPFVAAYLDWLININDPVEIISSNSVNESGVFLYVLGNVQDGGSPHIGCTKKCCIDLYDHPDPSRMVVSLGLVDDQNKQCWMFDASPDFSKQVYLLSQYSDQAAILPNGIFLTHAHIGHYSGLMYLGREAMNSKNVSVYVQPRMKNFLELNGPWSQLVNLNNIRLIAMDSMTSWSNLIKVRAILVPHRDEYSETVGYLIEGPVKKAVYIPDIDKWEKWNKDIRKLINEIDYAFLDGTFYSADELPNRDIKEIPHPLVSESFDYFQHLSKTERNKIYFIHFNHTNPLLNKTSVESKRVEELGFHIARLGMKFKM